MRDLFLRACRGEPVERPPVWLMRQAGRYLPEYRAVRRRVDFLTLCRTPELAAEVTVQPVDILGVDAAIQFADILLPLDAMGARLVMEPGDGPTFPEPVRSAADAARLRRPDVERDLGFVCAALEASRRALDGRVPLIGFAGAPWTLAAYLVEGKGSKHFPHLLEWSYADPAGLGALLERLAEVTADYLAAQLAAGAQALQLFDTWAGLLDLERWRRLAQPAIERSLAPLQGTVPLIYYANGGGHLLEGIRELPVDVISVDWRMPLDRVREIVGADRVLQGNLDPGALLGSAEQVVASTERMLAALGGERHIANLGHGILPQTPVESARCFVDTVRRQTVAGQPATA